MEVPTLSDLSAFKWVHDVLLPDARDKLLRELLRDYYIVEMLYVHGDSKNIERIIYAPSKAALCERLHYLYDAFDMDVCEMVMGSVTPEHRNRMCEFLNAMGNDDKKYVYANYTPEMKADPYFVYAILGIITPECPQADIDGIYELWVKNMSSIRERLRPLYDYITSPVVHKADRN